MTSKPILLIPMAGQGSRFKKAGILTPKQLLLAGDKSCLERSFDSFRNLRDFKIVFGVNDVRVGDAAMAYARAKNLDAQCVNISETNAPTETLAAMIDGVSNLADDAIVYVFTMDIEIYPAITIDTNFTVDGVTYTFTSSTPNYSYVKQENGRITEIAEKKVISQQANIGLYGFRLFASFKNILRICEGNRRQNHSETHVSDMIRILLSDHRFEIRGVEGVHVFGTPQEFDFYMEYILPQRPRQRLGVFSDHSGFAVKTRFVSALKDAGFDVTDFGAHHSSMSNYAIYATDAVEALHRGECDILLSFCRTGQGVNIALNKLSHKVLSAVVYDENALEYALAHNCARGLCFPETAWLERDLANAISLLRDTIYEGGRHTDRLRNTVKAYLTPDNPGAAILQKLEQFKGGWVVGAFTPTLVSTSAVEVAIKRATADWVPNGHFHKIATEYTLILSGKAEDQGRIYSYGDIITLRPMERNYTRFLEDTLMLSIKTPSIADDKYD